MNIYNLPVPPLRSRVSTLYLHKCAVSVTDTTLTTTDKTGVLTGIPVGSVSAILLGPGTTITHEAIKHCANTRTLIVWVGENGVRLYSAGQEGAAHSYRLLRQARLALNDKHRLRVSRWMYEERFNEHAPKKRSIEQLRGMEGARVREMYREFSTEFGVEWNGRKYNRQDWRQADDINRTISAANSCLYGLCHAAILIAGYSAAIGFIHTGYSLAFVHDVADMFKMEFSVKAAFEAVATNPEKAEYRVRHHLRNKFKEGKLLERLIPFIAKIIEAGEGDTDPPKELGGATIDLISPEEFPWYGKQVN